VTFEDWDTCGQCGIFQIFRAVVIIIIIIIIIIINLYPANVEYMESC
jgi:uncharacterized integral membrane protein